MFTEFDQLQRVLISSLGAALFSIGCLLAAAGPVQAETVAQAQLDSAPISQTR